MLFKKKLLLFLFPFVLHNTQAQIISTIVGNGVEGYNGDGIPGTEAYLKGPSGVFAAEGNRIFFTDIYNHRLRYINPAGMIFTLAGTGDAGYNGDNILANEAELNRPSGICIDSAGDIYIADWMNNRVRKIDHVTGKIITLAGAGTGGYNGDGIPAVSAKLNAPDDVAVDKQGNVFIADHNNDRIRKIDKATGLISTIAGTGMSAYYGDGGPAAMAALNQPTGICLSPHGGLVIVDHGNAVIRQVDSLGIITTIAGNNIEAFGGDSMPAIEASFDHPTSAIFDTAGNLYISDQGNNRIRKIDRLTGIITTFAGNGSEGFGGDGGDPLEAMLYAPWDMIFDSLGNMYVTDLMNNRVRKISPKEQTVAISTIAQNKITLYPNPAADHITITPDAGLQGEVLLTIADMNGNNIYEQLLDASMQKTIGTAAFAKGIYVLKLQNADNCYEAEFIVQ